MKVHDKEFEEMRYQFEKDMRESVYGHVFTREPRELSCHGVFYTDGFINSLFRAYSLGYSFRAVL